MSKYESIAIIERAEELFKGKMTFSQQAKEQIAQAAEGYPYFVQLLGKECVAKANELGKNCVDNVVYTAVMEDIQKGRSFPTLERSYQRAIGSSEDRQLLLHLLADQPEEETLFDEDVGRIFLKKARKDAEELDINYIDQLIPRLLDSNFGPALARVPENPGIYDFVNPVFRLYVRLRQF